VQTPQQNLPAMPLHHLPTAAPAARLSRHVTRRQLEQLLSPDSSASPHERQRALVQASLLTREQTLDPASRHSGWVPG
jgi:hypothetical protein